MYIVVTIQPPLPEGTAAATEQAHIQVNVRLVDRLSPNALAELEQDLTNSLNLLVNTWGLS